MSYAEMKRNDARLVILRALADENDGRLNETIITKILDAFGHCESRDWVRTQIRALNDLGVITYSEISSIMVANITQLGLDHVERRTVVEGVSRPSPKV